MKNISEMTAKQLQAAIDKQDSVFDSIVSEMIAAGRGYEKPNETAEKTDALSNKFNKNRNLIAELSFERRKRLDYQGNLKSIVRDNPASNIRKVTIRKAAVKKPYPCTVQFRYSIDGEWHELAGFVDEKTAVDFAKSYAEKNSSRYVRVLTD